MGDQICFSFDKTNREPGEASSQTLRAHLVWVWFGFHNSVLIIQNSNPTITQKLWNFCLVTKSSHKSQLKYPPHWHYTVSLLLLLAYIFSSLSFIFSCHTTQKNRVAHKPKVDLSPPIFHFPFINTHKTSLFPEINFMSLHCLNFDRHLGLVSTNLGWNSRRWHRPNYCIR